MSENIKEYIKDNIKEVKKGDIIFREGDDGNCMYYVAGLSKEEIGLYTGYETDNQVLITKVTTGAFIGEMSVLADAKRSATAVALSDAVLHEIPKEGFRDYFSENPGYMLELLKQAASNLRRLTNDYMAACDLACDYVEAKETGNVSDDIKSRLKVMCG